MGWDEILEGGLPEGAVVQSWRGMEGAIEATHLGTDAVVSPTSHCYLDTRCVPPTWRRSIPSSRAAKGHPGQIIGGECNMWTERAPEAVMGKVLPRAQGWPSPWSGPEVTEAEGAYEASWTGWVCWIAVGVHGCAAGLKACLSTWRCGPDVGAKSK